MTGNSDVTLTELAKALVNEEFVYYYQPKVSMVTGQISGAEALIRGINRTAPLSHPASSFLWLNQPDLFPR